MKTLINNQATINNNILKKSFEHNGINVLNVDIEYPSVTFPKRYSVQKKINEQLRNIANNFYTYAEVTLLPNSIEHYDTSIKYDFPFHPFEAMMKYTVTLNDDCTLSLYYNQYEYTGGAHGMTVRISKTFNLQTGYLLELKDFFINNENYKKMLILKLQKKAEANYSEDPGIYFEDYKQLIVDSFNEKNFYLTPDTFDFYFQQYDIAPYASGIVVLSIPYEELFIEKPHCKYN